MSSSPATPATPAPGTPARGPSPDTSPGGAPATKGQGSKISDALGFGGERAGAGESGGGPGVRKDGGGKEAGGGAPIQSPAPMGPGAAAAREVKRAFGERLEPTEPVVDPAAAQRGNAPWVHGAQTTAATTPMVAVPAGEFLFGEDRRTDKLAAFEIDRDPVTNGEYEVFVLATGHRPPLYWKAPRCPDDLREHPVVGVDYFDAVAYARWAGKDLPFEDEWERAARGTDGRQYPWGDEPDLAANTARTGLKMTVPVGFFPKNVSPVGCRDLVGNAWELTHTPAPGGGVVVRGGSWFDFALYAKTTFRLASRPESRNGTIGFRCVRRASPRVGAPRAVPESELDAAIAARRGKGDPVDVTRFSPERRDLVPDVRRLRQAATARDEDALAERAPPPFSPNRPTIKRAFTGRVAPTPPAGPAHVPALPSPGMASPAAPALAGSGPVAAAAAAASVVPPAAPKPPVPTVAAPTPMAPPAPVRAAPVSPVLVTPPIGSPALGSQALGSQGPAVPAAAPPSLAPKPAEPPRSPPPAPVRVASTPIASTPTLVPPSPFATPPISQTPTSQAPTPQTSTSPTPASQTPTSTSPIPMAPGATGTPGPAASSLRIVRSAGPSSSEAAAGVPAGTTHGSVPLMYSSVPASPTASAARGGPPPAAPLTPLVTPPPPPRFAAPSSTPAVAPPTPDRASTPSASMPERVGSPVGAPAPTRTHVPSPTPSAALSPAVPGVGHTSPPVPAPYPSVPPAPATVAEHPSSLRLFLLVLGFLAAAIGVVVLLTKLAGTGRGGGADEAARLELPALVASARDHDVVTVSPLLEEGGTFADLGKGGVLLVFARPDGKAGLDTAMLAVDLHRRLRDRAGLRVALVVPSGGVTPARGPSSVADDLRALGVTGDLLVVVDPAGEDGAPGRWRRSVWNVEEENAAVLLEDGVEVLRVTPPTNSAPLTRAQIAWLGRRADQDFAERAPDVVPTAPSAPMDAR